MFLSARKQKLGLLSFLLLVFFVTLNLILEGSSDSSSETTTDMLLLPQDLSGEMEVLEVELLQDGTIFSRIPYRFERQQPG